MFHASRMHQRVDTVVFGTGVGGQLQGHQGYLHRNHLIAAVGSRRSVPWLQHGLSPECGGILE